MQKTVKKRTAAVILIVTICVAICLGIWMFPKMIASKTTSTITPLYPDYSFEELAENSDRIEYCTLIKVEKAKYTKTLSGGDMITTDYLFRSNEDETYLFVLRLSGGTVNGNSMEVAGDTSREVLSKGKEYVLFLRSRQTFSADGEIYTVDGRDICVYDCYALLSGDVSVFSLTDAATETVVSVKEKYAVDKTVLLEYCANDAAAKEE